MAGEHFKKETERHKMIMEEIPSELNKIINYWGNLDS